MAARPSDGPGSAPLYGLPLKFACLLLSLSPNAVAVVVPARQAYSHCASVGSRNSHPAGKSPEARASAVRIRQNASVSAKLTFPTGRSSPSGSSAVGSPETVRAGLQRFIALTNADELMVTAPIFDHQARRRSYEILADIARSTETKISQQLEQQ